MREIVIDRAMAAPGDPVSLDDLKIIVLMVYWSFGREPDLRTILLRDRFSVNFKPAAWLKFSAMAQDCRAPGYGPNAPSTVRDPIDLQESYVELFADRKKGFGLNAGRMMINYS